MIKKSVWRPVLSVILVLVFALGIFGCGKSTTTAASSSGAAGGVSVPAYKMNPNKTEIVIGGARPMTGVYAFFYQSSLDPVYKMWVDDVNKAGGIFVKEYNKKMKIKLIIYDDKSDMGTMTQLLTKLCVDDKVDFLLPPCSTAFLYAAVPIAAKYGKVMLGAEGGSATLKEASAKYPNYFAILNYCETQVPALVKVLKDSGIKSAYITFIEDLHGQEYSGAAVPQLTQAGIDIKGVKSLPPDIQDMTPILNDAKATGADAYLQFAYPVQNNMALQQAQALGYNPKVFLLGPGAQFDYMKSLLGDAGAINGLMGWGGWNEKSSPACAEFSKKLYAFVNGDKNFSMDWWGHAPYYASLQILQQAIEQSGTLNNKAIWEYIAAHHFQTVLGDTFFTNNELDASCYLGDVSQWQNGVYEVIQGSHKTADPIIPKPAWPAPKK